MAGLNAAAARHGEHPRLQDEIRTFTELIFEIASASLSCYQERKRLAGLLDFIDLEELCLTLLDLDPVRDSMKERLDVVLVDEFQDTSPIQLELFLKLASLAKNSIWVGDQKQSIFEFRGADPMLMQSVLDAIKKLRPPSQVLSVAPPARTVREQNIRIRASQAVDNRGH